MNAKIRDVTTNLTIEMELPYANALDCLVGAAFCALATRSHTSDSGFGAIFGRESRGLRGTATGCEVYLG